MQTTSSPHSARVACFSARSRGRRRTTSHRTNAQIFRREVEWVGNREGYNYDNIPDLRSRLQVQRDVLDLTQQIETLHALLEGTSNGPNEPVVVEEVILRDATAKRPKCFTSPRLVAEVH